MVGQDYSSHLSFDRAIKLVRYDTPLVHNVRNKEEEGEDIVSRFRFSERKYQRRERNSNNSVAGLFERATTDKKNKKLNLGDEVIYRDY